MFTAHDSRWLPVAGLLFGAVAWGVLWYPLRMLEAAGLSGLWATLAIYGGTVPMLHLLFRPGYRAMAHHWRIYLTIALAAGWCNTGFILGVLSGDVVRVILLFYLSPVWAVLLARFLLCELLTRRDVAVLATAMSGGLTILWSPEMGYPWPQSLADWYGLSAGVGFALSNVAVREGRALPIDNKLAASWLGVVLVALLSLLLVGAEFPRVSAGVWTLAGALGALGITAMTVSVYFGVARLPLKHSMTILLVEVLAGALSAHWLAGEIIGLSEWIGGALILLATVIAATGGRNA